jgi:hypothetical protein
VTNTDTGTATLNAAFTYITQQFDANGDQRIDPSDIFYLVNYLFLSGQPPRDAAGMMSGDANGDGLVDPSDIFYLVNYLFLSGPQPMVTTGPEVRADDVSDRGRIAGSLTLGRPVEKDGRYLVPVVLTLDAGSDTPQAFALRVSTRGAMGTSIRRAGAAKDVDTAFEVSPASEQAVVYLVSFGQSKGGLALGGEAIRSAVVAEIELSAAEAGGFSLEIDPAVTMLSNSSGTRSATVAGGTLRVSGTGTVAGRRLPVAERP